MTVDVSTLLIRIDSSEARTAARNMDQMRDAGARAEQQASSLDAVTRKLTQTLQLLGVGAGVGAIIRMADEYTKYTAQLKLATQSQREYNASVDEVRRIANTAQQDLAATGTLYARIANGTRELGVQQKQVAAITETVNLALKVSGATAAESASAQLQLSQAFASGTLRGEEFNAVNEAAPRLMKALADGIGVPIGALRNMATEGQITSKIMADVLPGALAQLREEAKQVQTIGGAFTVLKNNIMEFVGVQAQASGTVAVMTGAIGLLADSLNVLAGAALTLVAVKLVNWLDSTYDRATQAVAANRALAAANLATAQSDQVAALSADRLAQARVLELRAAVLAADGNVALAITTNGLIPAELNAIRTTNALAASNTALAVAQRAASVGSAALQGAIGFLGGPLGAIVTVLGLAATAWSWYSSKAEQANKDTAKSTEESHVEMVERLNKQIELLRQRAELLKAVPKVEGANAADVEGLARRKAELDAIQKGTGHWAGESESTRQMAEIDALARYTEALNLVATAQKEVKAAAEGTREQQLAKWYGENGTAAQRLAAELEKLKKQFGEIPPAMEAIVRAKYIDKDGAATAKATVEARVEAIKSGIERERNLRAEGIARVTELSRQGLASDAEVFSARQAAALAAGTDAAAVFDAEIAALLAYNGKDEAARIANNAKIKDLGVQRAEALRASLVAAEQLQLAYGFDKDKPARDAEAASRKEILAINDQIDATERQIAAYNKLPSAISEATVAMLEEQKVALSGIEGSEKAVADIDTKIAAYSRLAQAQKSLQGLDAGTDVAKAEQLLKILQAVDEAARQAASGMEASFGAVGKAIGGLTTALTGYAVQQQAIAAQLAAVKADPKSGAQKIAQAEIAASKASAQAQIKSYGDMAGAAKGFFKENSKGYKALETTEKAFRAYEMAMALEAMVKKVFFKEGEVAANTALNATKLTGEAATTAASTGLAATEASAWGITAVVKAIASLPFPLNLAAGAATLAAVVAIGAKVMGSVGSGRSAAQQRQETQGTGSVLGDSSAKSESIARAIALTAENSNIELSHTAGMLAALKSIDSNIAGLGSLVVRTTGITGNVAADTVGSAQALAQSVLGNIPLIGGILGGTVGKLVGSIFGGATSVTDTGIVVGKNTISGISAGGVNANQYTDTTKKGGWFSSDKHNTELKDLGGQVDDQFAKVILGLADSVKQSAVLLGVGGDEFTARLNSFVVDLGKISLKGLTGAQIQEQLEAVFSKLGDDMAQFAVGGLSQFQKVGEGYFETLSRIAADYANLDSILASSGTAFGATGMASIAARERLIELAGGIDKLSSQASSFNESFLTQAEQLAPVQKYVTDQLAAMGLQSLDTRDKFKDYVLGLANSGALATEAGAQQYTALLALAEAFAKTHAATVDLTKSEQEIADERADLQNKLDELTMTQAQLAEKARNAISAQNLALYDQVIAAQAAKDAAAAAAEAQKAAADAIVKAQESAKASMQSLGGALVDSMNKAMEAAKAFRALNDSLLIGDLSVLNPEQKYLEAKRQFETADSSNLQAAEKAFLDASKAWFGGSAGYAVDFQAVLARNQAEAAAQDAAVQGIINFWRNYNGIDGSHRDGLERVPFDGYVAELHRDERVQTASQVRDGDAAAQRANELLAEVVAQLGADKVQRGAAANAQISETRALRAEVAGLKRKIAVLEKQ